MRILAIDTATKWLSVSVLEDTLISGEVNVHTKKSHSTHLMNTIDFILDSLALEPQMLELVAVSQGPGSFTGLRIGMACAKSLAFSLNCPIIGVSTLRALANSALESTEETDFILPLIDARRGEYFGSLFRLESGNLKVQYENKVSPLAEIIKSVPEKVHFCGKLDTSARKNIEDICEVSYSISNQASPLNLSRYIAFEAMNVFSSSGAYEVHNLCPIYIRQPDIH